jgi:predicted TIM-barrel fold metal-dependent hydrolase
MRIDAHQHSWRYNPTDYAWMSDAMDVLPPPCNAGMASAPCWMMSQLRLALGVSEDKIFDDSRNFR